MVFQSSIENSFCNISDMSCGALQGLILVPFFYLIDVPQTSNCDFFLGVNDSCFFQQKDILTFCDN